MSVGEKQVDDAVLVVAVEPTYWVVFVDDVFEFSYYVLAS
jgi:hypothetical protein